MTVVTFDPRAILQQVDKAAAQALRRAAFQVFTVARKKVDIMNPGGKYARKGSVPPAPPYKRTGRLQRSILYKVDEAAQTADVGILHKAVGFYGNFLEFGYINGKKQVAPRPFVRPAFEETPIAKYFVNMV